MKAFRRWWAACALPCAIVSAAAAAELWVAPSGDDQHAGTKDQPFATLAMAQRRARELRRTHSAAAQSGVTIFVRGGTYALTAPLWFRVEDSGTAASPTIIAAASGERPVFSGGVAITGWQKPSAPVAGLPAAAVGRVWVADAPRIGGRALEFRQLWVGAQKAVRSRTPNGESMSRLAGWDRVHQRAVIAARDLGGLAAPGSAEMVVEQQWEIAILRLASMEREGDKVRLGFAQPESAIEFAHPWPQPILPPEGGGGFFLANAIEFLDSPGEWYEDLAAGRVYYWPRDNEDLARDAVIAPVLASLVVVDATLDRPVEHVEFRGLTFTHTAWTRPSRTGHVPLQAAMPFIEAYSIAPPGTPDKRSLENQAWIERTPAAVYVANSNAIRFTRCNFEHLAMSGLDFGRGTHDSVAEGCVFRDVGGNGVQAGCFQEGGVETHVPYQPADAREVCSNLRIANNLITDIANEDWGCVGVIAGYGRNLTIEHNEISYTSYTGISVGWGWTPTITVTRDNSIHANLIHHIARRVCDTAGVYMLSAQAGSVVSENVVRDIVMSPSVDRPDHWFYLYTDEGSSNVTVRDNWCPAEKFLQNANGPGNVWRNNGPMVSEQIKAAAGLEPAFRDISGSIARE